MSTKPSAAGIRLSACMIVRDEEKVLEACLKSLQGLVDEIVIVDTGSKDGTMKVAMQFGAITSDFKWCDDFSAARNAGLELATGDWALWIDADESLPERFHALIREAVTSAEYAGFNIPIVNYMAEEGDSDQFVHVPTRLFQLRPSVRFSGRIHEQIAPSLRKLGKPIGALEGVFIEHQGYRPSIVASRDKTARTIAILELELREQPEDSFQWFNMANAHAVAGNLDEAESCCGTALRTLAEGDAHGSCVHQLLVEVLERAGKHEQALEAVARSEAEGFSAVSTEFGRATALFHLGRFDEALKSIERCLAMEWPSNGEGDYSIVTYKRYLLGAQILTVLKQYDRAQELLDVALCANPNSVPVQFAKATLDELVGNHKDALARFAAIQEEPSLEAICLQGMARCQAALGRFSEASVAYERAWKIDPTNIDVWIGWVQVAEASGDAAAVLHAFEGFVKAHEPSVDILINWGRALQAAGDFERALNCFAEALKRDPENANGYFNCGDLLYQMGQYADAAHLYEAGLKQMPLNAQGWFVLGNAFARLGLADGARLAYRQCLAIQPKHAEAQSNLEAVSHDLPLAG